MLPRLGIRLSLPTVQRSPQEGTGGATSHHVDLEVRGGFPGTIRGFAIFVSFPCLEASSHGCVLAGLGNVESGYRLPVGVPFVIGYS